MKNPDQRQMKISEEEPVFSFVRRCKFAKLSPSKEELRRALLDAGVGPTTEFKDFAKMNFKIGKESISAQTLMRRFGNGSRSSKSLAKILSWVGIVSRYNANKQDYSDPEVIKSILLSSKIDMQTVKFKEFINQKIMTDKFIGSGRELVINFQNSAVEKVKNNDQQVRPEIAEYVSKLRCKERKFVPLRSSFETMLKLADIKNINYASIKYRPKILREILESSGADFNNWFISISAFFKMRFDSKHLRELDKRNPGTISGQALAKRYFGTNALRNEHIKELLVAAGYKPKRVIFPSELKNPKILYKIIKSCRQKVDLSRIRFKDFKNLEFDSDYFMGKGHTLLKWYGKVSSTAMRDLLGKVGIMNPVPARWKKRIERLSKDQ